MASQMLEDYLISTWKTNDRVTSYLVEHIPDELWTSKIPGYSRRTVRMIAGHLHNTRCMWIKATGKNYVTAVPEHVNKHRLTRFELLTALERSSQSVIQILEFSLRNQGKISGFSPGDVMHFATYLMTHEGHHRGQLCMVARQLGFDLTDKAVYGLWQWSKRSREAES